MGINHPSNLNDPGSILPHPDFSVQPVYINQNQEMVYAIENKDGSLFFPCVTLCNYLPRVNGETVYNKVRKRFKPDTRRMLVDDEYLARYRRLVGASRNIVKVFIDINSLLSIAKEAGLEGPLITDMNYQDFLVKTPSSPVSFGQPGSPSRNQDDHPKSARENKRKRTTGSSLLSNSTTIPADQNQSRQNSDEIQLNLPTIGRLVPPASRWPEIFTPHTLEIKVTRSGQKPHFVHWTLLNPTDRFLVFKACIESMDPILERKRPWIAKFISLEFDDDDLAYYESKLRFPFSTHLSSILATADLPTDNELAALLEANAYASSVRNLAADQAQSHQSPTKRRLHNPPKQVGPLVTDHHTLLIEAIGRGDFAAAFATGSDSNHGSGPVLPEKLKVLTNTELSQANYAMTTAMHAMIQSLGSFYYDSKVESTKLADELASVRAELATERALRAQQVAAASPMCISRAGSLQSHASAMPDVVHIPTAAANNNFVHSPSATAAATTASIQSHQSIDAQSIVTSPQTQLTSVDEPMSISSP